MSTPPASGGAGPANAAQAARPAGRARRAAPPDGQATQRRVRPRRQAVPGPVTLHASAAPQATTVQQPAAGPLGGPSTGHGLGPGPGPSAMLAELRALFAQFQAAPLPAQPTLEQFVFRDVFGQGLPLMIHDLERHAGSAQRGGGGGARARSAVPAAPSTAQHSGPQHRSSSSSSSAGATQRGGGSSGAAAWFGPAVDGHHHHHHLFFQHAFAAPTRAPPPVAVPACDRTGAFPVTDINPVDVPDTECCVCADARANMTLSPCGHSVLCRACALRMRSEGLHRCPECNVPIERVLPLLLGAMQSAPAGRNTTAPAPTPAPSPAPAPTQAPTTATPAQPSTWRELDEADNEAVARRLQEQEFAAAYSQRGGAGSTQRGGGGGGGGGSAWSLD